ncbi:hypothetical protein Tco_0155286 [Tanacetum coccineum]
MLASSHYWNVSKQTTRIYISREYLSITRMFCKILQYNARTLVTTCELYGVQQVYFDIAGADCHLFNINNLGVGAVNRKTFGSLLVPKRQSFSFERNSNG